MDYLDMTDDDYQNPDPLSPPRGIFHAFIITAAVIAVAVGFFWH